MEEILILAGGRPMADFVPSGYSGKIADVYFSGENVVAEVKSITTDRSKSPEMPTKLGDYISTNSHKYGGPVIFGEVTLRLHDLPEPLAKGSLRILGQRIQTEVAAANKQVKATKKMLGQPSAKGLLVFITPPMKIDPHTIGWLVNDAMRGDQFYRSINSVMIVRSPVSSDFQHSEGFNSFLSFHSRGGYELSLELRERIGSAWGVKTGQTMIRADEDEFFQRFP
jgi:hypothetical protein